ncbi:hypothetical protein C8J56DRAFT_161587 [Mycena floridula]|nr:hypothetical protein C8J56DRAFT_161587 [Mycena floridula]
MPAQSTGSLPNMLSSRRLKFEENLANLPVFSSPIDEEMHEYIMHMGDWPQANYKWHFESKRYFGSKAPEVEETRCVPLIPQTGMVTLLNVDEIKVPAYQTVPP